MCSAGFNWCSDRLCAHLFIPFLMPNLRWGGGGEDQFYFNFMRKMLNERKAQPKNETSDFSPHWPECDQWISPQKRLWNLSPFLSPLTRRQEVSTLERESFWGAGEAQSAAGPTTSLYFLNSTLTLFNFGFHILTSLSEALHIPPDSRHVLSPSLIQQTGPHSTFGLSAPGHSMMTADRG